MKINIKDILHLHRDKTGEDISLNQFAAELVEKGFYNGFRSARSTLQRINSGKQTTVKIEFLDYLVERFNLDINEILN